MNHYTLTTIHGIADSDYLDRLAELVYELPNLVNTTLALNEDGSVTASFDVEGSDPIGTLREALPAFTRAVKAARPLRVPGVQEGFLIDDEATSLGGIAISTTGDREAIPA